MRLIQDGPPLPRCCTCGVKYTVKFCPWCGHSFCFSCRNQPWFRTKAALKEFFLGDPPRYCNHG